MHFAAGPGGRPIDIKRHLRDEARQSPRQFYDVRLIFSD